jgi:hypothetical protein
MLFAAFCLSVMPLHASEPASNFRYADAQAFLVHHATNQQASARDAALFCIARQYSGLWLEKEVVQDAFDQSLNRAMGGMKAVATNETWSSDLDVVLCLAPRSAAVNFGDGFHALWKQHRAWKPAKKAAADFAAAYSGTNALVEATVKWIASDYPDFVEVADQEVVAFLSALTLDDLVKRKDAVLCSCLLIEYFWRNTSGKTAEEFHRIRRMAVDEIPNAWNEEQKCYVFPGSANGAFVDTCVAVIIRGGFYGVDSHWWLRTLGTWGHKVSVE